METVMTFYRLLKNC